MRCSRRLSLPRLSLLSTMNRRGNIAAAFLLLKDSKASYAIEGERPAYNRAERWGRAIGQAGQQKLTPQELMRLQEIVIGDKRFTKMGWRKEGGFIGVQIGRAH